MISDNESIPEDSTQQKILTAAISEFAEFGKAGARVDRIAEQAGVNKAMIYYHFNSKENLYYSSVSEHFVQIASTIQQRISGDISLEDMISGLVEVHIQSFRSSPYFKQIVLRELAEDNSPIIERIADALSKSGAPAILSNKLKSEIESGRVRELDIKQAIASLISMSIGFFIVSPIISRTLGLGDFDKFVSARKEAVVNLFLNGVLVK